MAIGFKHGSAGGDVLGIRVVSGMTRPSAPKENTIWVNSTNDIRSWYISPTEPIDVSGNGHFWIKTDDNSPVSMEILRKNSVIVHPGTVYESTGSGWAEREAQIYRQGAWAELKTSFYIYNKGISTGYSLACNENMKQMSSGYTAVAGYVTVGSTSITVETDGRTYDFANIFVTDPSGAFTRVDLSKYTKIRIKGALSGATKSTDLVFRLLSEMGTICTENNVASQSFTAGIIDATIDVSAIDSSCYLGFTFYNQEQITKVITFELTELWIE